MARFFVLFSLLSVLSGPAIAAEDPQESRSSTPDSNLHFLWRVVGPAAAEVFLLGSIHALPEDAYPLSDVINNAFESANSIYFEVDLEDTSDLGTKMMVAGRQPSGARLADALDPETRRLLDTYLESAELSFSTFDGMKPWMAALTLTSIELMSSGFSADAGLDLHFARRAHKDGKKVDAFETADYQIGLFSGMNQEESLSFLRYTLRDMDNVVAQLGTLTEAWEGGNVAVLSSLLTEAFADEPVLFEQMVTVRNQAWLPQIEELLQGEESAMVVVGALHLVGPNGLIELLRDQGYRIDQL